MRAQRLFTVYTTFYCQLALSRRSIVAKMEDYRVSVVGGGKPLLHGGILAQDGRHFIVPFNNQLRVYFITTRQCIRSLKFNVENQIDLTGLVDLKQDLSNENLVWAFLVSGEVLVINWKEKVPEVVINRFTVELNKDDFVLRVSSFEEDNFTLITGKNSPKPHTRNVVRFTPSKNQYETLTSIKNVLLFAVSQDSRKLAFLSESHEAKSVHIVNMDSLDKKQSIPFANKNLITALAIANDCSVAVGTRIGVIHIILDSFTRLLKWHIDEVKSLCFSQNSKYLMSGGLERVLVFWQLDTEKQQFLPRLNGAIVGIESPNEEYINTTLQLDSENHEILVLSAVDLQSRLVVGGPRQSYSSNLANVKKLDKLYAKNPSLDIMKLKYDFSTNFKIHPTSKQLYFVNGAYLQVFDFFKNEQAFVQKVTDTIQTGKVRSEQKLHDPVVKHFQFTRDGKWMATMEEHQHGDLDNLLSKNDFTYVLKIWRSVETQVKNGSGQASWEVVTKIVNPHGVNIPVHALIAAPLSYFKGVGFLTADNNGGVRVWRPTTNNLDDIVRWSLRKLKPSTGIFSNDVSLAWSEDSSLIFLGFGETVEIIDTDTFEEIPNDTLARIAGSQIKSLEIVDNQLCILSKTSLKSVDLLTMQENDLVLRVSSPKNGNNLMCTNTDKSLICIAVNFYNRDLERLQAKIFVFTPHSKTPVFNTLHDGYICGIQWNFDTDFIFIDINSRIGLVTSTRLEEDRVEEIDHAREMAILLQRAQGESSLKKKTKTDLDLGSDEINGARQLDVNSFAGLFDSMDVQLSTMFDRVMQVVR